MKKPMKKYKVNVTRTAYANLDIEVKARNVKEAKKLALEAAGDEVFSEKDADYDVDYVERIEE